MRAKSDHMRMLLLAAGVILVIASPIVGVLPGPGGIFVFAGGLVLLLRNSAWVRRRYAALKRKWPKAGHVCDRAMRRPSAIRRSAVAKARMARVD